MPAERQAVADLLHEFQLSFDLHDWDRLVRCLTTEVTVDYQALRREPPRTIGAAEFAAERRMALGQLDLQHNYSNLRIESGPPVTAQCNFQIYRFSRETNAFFHSWGRYQFEFVLSDGSFLIRGIRQDIIASQGDPMLHGGIDRLDRPNCA